MIHYYTDKTISAGVLIEQSIHQLTASANSFSQTKHLVIRFCHSQYYLPDQAKLELLALVSIKVSNKAVVVIEGSISPFVLERFENLRFSLDQSANDNGDDLLESYCHNHALPWLVMSDPWLLAPVHVPKPWGQEIWYTGIEARGQAGVLGDGGSIPLAWMLELLSMRAGLLENSPPILLKTLDPLPDEVYGDLYFELHQEKQEVYVVTHIDRQAWPGGVGAIQLGFEAQARQDFKTENDFKQAYLKSVKDYERIRRLIDHKLDEKKTAEGFEVGQPNLSSQLVNWMSELSKAPENNNLFVRENELRQAMNRFVARYPLTVGDVVTVPKLVPHSLQHGVRVVEFQTPVYERKILSFGQKVLTQSHWDTAEALELADLDFAQLQAPELLELNSHLRIERIVNFDDFEVRRILLDGRYVFHEEIYSVMMVLQGQLTLAAAGATKEVEAGQAVLLPKSKNGWLMSNSASCLFLLASPHRQPNRF